MVSLINHNLIDPSDLPPVTIHDANTGQELDGRIPDGRQVTIRFECPLCGDEKERTHETPVGDYTRVPCYTKDTTYPLQALTLPPSMDETLKNRVAVELLAVDRTWVLQQRYPDEMGAISGAPSAFFDAAVTTLFSIVGVVSIAVAFPQAIQTDIRFALGFLLITLSLGFGVASVILGTGPPCTEACCM